MPEVDITEVGLLELRKTRSLSRAKLTDELKKMGYDLGASAYLKWEKGITRMPVIFIPPLAEIFEVPQVVVLKATLNSLKRGGNLVKAAKPESRQA